MSAVDEDRQAPDANMLLIPFMDTSKTDSLHIGCTANKTFYRHD